MSFPRFLVKVKIYLVCSSLVILALPPEPGWSQIRSQKSREGNLGVLDKEECGMVALGGKKIGVGTSYVQRSALSLGFTHFWA